MTIKYDSETIGLIAMFENISRAKVKDCFVDQNKQLIFVVEQNELSKAIGKAGQNVKLFEQMSKKKVRIIEFDKDIQKFIKNIVYPTPIAEMKQEADVITIIPADPKSRGMLIGRAAQTLRYTEAIVKRYFPIKELCVE